MRYGSVCSGIEAASVAWHPLGWRPQFLSEIEAAPRAILKHHFPEVPLHGDFTTIREGEYGPIDLLVGGTPCQSFSVAGLRGGLADGRGNLALEYLRLAQRLRPRWLAWENVPGVLSSNGGRDFGAILGGMVELGYGFAYRVLDAQYVRVDGYGRAVPQRRRRVFVVGHLGDWRRAAAVLLERASLRGDPAPRRSSGQIVAASLTGSLGRRGGQPDGGDTEGHLIAMGDVAHSLRGEGFDASEDGTGRGTPIISVAGTLCSNRKAAGSATSQDAENGLLIAFHGAQDPDPSGPVTHPLGRNGGLEACIAFDTTQITSRENRANPQPSDPCHPLSAGAHPPAIAFSCKDYGADATSDGVTPTLRAMGFDRSHANAGGQLAVAFDLRNGTADDVSMSLQSGGMGDDRGLCPNAIPHTITGWAVRRLTPTECERLQGFPDGWTAVPWRGGIMPDGPRYKALGNSMAVNCMRWIGRRIEMVEALEASAAPAPLLAAE